MWQMMAIAFAIVIVAMVATVTVLLRKAAVPTNTANADGTRNLTIDNSKLLIAIGFAQKPNGHVDPIMADAQGRIICAPQPATDPGK